MDLIYYNSVLDNNLGELIPGEPTYFNGNTIIKLPLNIKCINEYYRKNIIDKLKLDLKRETDPMKQANILKEMMKIRGVKTSD